MTRCLTVSLESPVTRGAARTVADLAEQVSVGAAQVSEALALQGLQGDTGYMPPKGGRVDLSDEEIIAAVDYIVLKSQ